MSRRSAPLGWLAPVAVVPPSAALGALLSVGGHGDPVLRAATGALVAGVLAALCAAWAMREVRPWRLFARVVGSAVLAGGIGLAAVLYGFDSSPSGWFEVGAFGAAGTLLGLVWGIAGAAVLAIVLRAHRGPRRARRVALLTGAMWTGAALAMLAVWDWHASAPVVGLLAAGAGAIALSPLCRASDHAAPEAVLEESGPAPYRVRWLGTLHLVGPGLVLGLCTLERSIPGEWLSGPLDLIVAGLAPALLAALAGAWSMRGRSPAWVAGRSLIACTIAGAMCAPLTYLLLVAVQWGAGPARADTETFLLVSLFGGAIGIPVGLGLGVMFAAALAAVARLSRGVLAPATERATVSVAWAMAFGGAVLIELTVEGGTMHGTVLAAAGAVLVAGLVLGGGASLRVVRALRLLSRARRGQSEYAIMRGSELSVDGATIAALPAYLPFGRLDAVLVRRVDPTSAPFREATVSELIARVAA